MIDKATKPANHLIEIKDYGQSIWMDNLTKYKEIFGSDQWQALAAKGAIQRLL